MSAYTEVPRHVARSFYRHPSTIPPTFCKAFMPRGGQKSSITEIERWCVSQFGAPNTAWARKSIYFFLTEDAAFMFKMRWC